MPTKSKKSRRTNNGQSTLLIFFAIIIVLAIISTIIAFYYQDETQEDGNQGQQNNTEQTSPGTSVIEGTWVSNYDGKILTIKGSDVTLESPSVDGTDKIKGNINVEENIVTLVYDSGSCQNIEGHYLYSINDAEELFLKLIKDSCENRIERMTMTWFKL